MYKKALTHFKKNDARLYNVGINFEIADSKASSDLFCDIARTIIGQQLSGKAANTIFTRFQALFPKKQVLVDYIQKISDADMRTCGLSAAKTRALRSLTEHVITKSLNLTNIQHLSNTDVITELTKVKGIGPWTAEMILMFSLGRTDIFSMGDLVLRREIMNLHGWKKEPSAKKLQEVLDRWSPYKTYAAKILWQIADSKKKKE